MATKKLGSCKAIDSVLITNVNLAADVSGVLPVANGGNGTGSFVDGEILIGRTIGNTLNKTTLTGTTDQVVVTNGDGTITLSLPQSLAPTSDPTFNDLTASSLSCPDYLTASGGMTFTPAAGSGVNFSLATTGDFVVNTNQFVVDTSAARVGINTSSPGAALDVIGVIRASTYYSVNNVGYIRGDTAGSLRFQGGSTDTQFRTSGDSSTIMTLLNGGNVGIGTTTPENKLQVENTWSVTGGVMLWGGDIRSGLVSNAGYLSYDIGKIIIGAFTSATNVEIGAPYNTPRITVVATTGNVGVGTTSPLGRFDSRATSGAQLSGSYDASN